jgi:hypothetical protein
MSARWKERCENNPMRRLAIALMIIIGGFALLAAAGCGAATVPVKDAAAPNAKGAPPLPPVGDGHKLFAGLTQDGAGPAGNRYVGSMKCAECHPDDYQAWRRTLHAIVVQDARSNPSVLKGDFTAPDLPFKKEEVEYTIGSHWDQRYLVPLGDDYVVLPRKWSVTSKVWEPYNVWSWKKRPYSKNCAGCHMTYFDPARKTIAEAGVGCEACHGPGGFHVDGDGDASKIVLPARLSSERSAMICASCHVRGTDPSGEYYFPIGFVPGQDLTPLLLLGEKDRASGPPGETPRGALMRIFAEWKKAIEDNARGRCDQCGIKTGTMTREQADAIKGFCFKCHDYGERESLHTRHPAEVTLTCYDCHVKRVQPAEAPDETAPGFRKKVLQGNVHSDSLFRVHIPNCYDPDIAKACLAPACHPGGRGKTAADPMEWARDTLTAWKRPVTVAH